MRAAAAVMGEGGSIINVSSNDGMRGRPGNLPYSVSKFGVRGASRSARATGVPACRWAFCA